MKFTSIIKRIVAEKPLAVLAAGLGSLALVLANYEKMIDQATNIFYPIPDVSILNVRELPTDIEIFDLSSMDKNKKLDEPKYHFKFDVYVIKKGAYEARNCRFEGEDRFGHIRKSDEEFLIDKGNFKKKLSFYNYRLK